MATSNTDKKKMSAAKKTAAGTTRKTTGTRSKTGSAKLSSDFAEEEQTHRKEYLCFGGGALLSLFAIFAFLAIISYMFTGTDDLLFIAGSSERSGNFMGNIGAYVAHFLVNRCFGYASVFLTIFLFAAGLRIMFVGDRNPEQKTQDSLSQEKEKENGEGGSNEHENPIFKIRLWKWFVNCGILTIWISVFVAGITLDLMDQSLVIKPGGVIGEGWVQLMDVNVGKLFRYIILAVIAIAYLCYLSSETIHIIRKMVRKPVEIIHDKVTHSDTTEDSTEAQPATTLIDPETGEVIAAADAEPILVDKETGEILNPGDNPEELTCEFRGGEDGPDHPEPADIPLASAIDKDTATTIVFTVEGDKGNGEEQGASETQAPIDDEMFGVSTGVEEEKADSNVALPQENTPAAEENAEMQITIGKENETAELTEEGALEPYDPKLDLSQYHYPTLDLLKHYDIDTRAIDMEEQNQNKNKIITVLRNFGVEISSIKATVGPTITLYEITPAPGVRIGKIRNLEDDIALSLAALGIRIIAPIPGKGTIGIEVPNAKPQIVSMESVINSKKFQESEMELPMALGKTITNEIFMADLAKMPHLLVAGATGQGKSVGLNAIITSLLYKKHPAELKLVMVDPKKVEFSVYTPLVNHFLAQVEGTEETDEPIITDVTKVIQTLKSLCLEMDTRYDLLKKAKARNVKEYNAKFKARQLNPNHGHKFMPYIVVIIDEFGDLIMTAGKEIELPIARIAQLARAVGIHMIIATQRPTTNIITGTIKANFPARMAFKVSAMIDSRTILDRPGANQLVGKGDMLFLAGNEPVRVQCAFVDTPEVEAINNHIACQQSYLNPFPLPYVEAEGADGDAPDVDMNHLDPMFEEVARLIVSTQQGSTSMIQRKFSIGYNRAGRLMDQMEVAGIVGPAHGSKPREVLCQSDLDLQNILSGLG